MLVVLAAYVLSWDFVGFLASTFLLLFFLFRCVEPLRWRTVLIASVLTLDDDLHSVFDAVGRTTAGQGAYGLIS